MTQPLIFWAQALDNSSPDHFQAKGKHLAPDDQSKREEAVSKVYDVIRTGACLFNESGIKFNANSHNFVVEIFSEQKDEAGRIAPIVCFGAHNGIIDDGLEKSVITDIDKFAKDIGRVLPRFHGQLS